MHGRIMSTGGEVANALVCKTSIRGFNSRPVLQTFTTTSPTDIHPPALHGRMQKFAACSFMFHTRRGCKK
jgi:hypothetical protein